MKIRPLFKHFGSKWMGAKHYPPPIDGCPVIEPYAGSAGYSLNHCDRAVTIWEDDPLLAELWRWILGEATPDRVRAIPLHVPEGTDIRSLELPRGESLLLKHWQRTNNVGDCWTISPWGNKPGQWTANTRARVADEIEAVRHWRFARPSFTEVATYFLDPPYEFNYRYRFRTPFDHAAMATQIRGLPAGCLVIACEARCPKTHRSPTYLPFRESHVQITSRRQAHEHTHSRELVWIADPRTGEKR